MMNATRFSLQDYSTQTKYERRNQNTLLQVNEKADKMINEL